MIAGGISGQIEVVIDSRSDIGMDGGTEREIDRERDGGRYGERDI